MGGNLGDPARTFAGALERLEPELGRLTVAPLYWTEPVSTIAQPDFLNTVAIGETRLAAEALLERMQEVELLFGRSRSDPDAPRTLDLDLLILGDEIREDSAPLLPHPRMRSRRFVLAPLFDVAPNWRLPPDGATPGELLAALPERPWVRRVEFGDAGPRSPGNVRRS